MQIALNNCNARVSYLILQYYKTQVFFLSLSSVCHASSTHLSPKHRPAIWLKLGDERGEGEVVSECRR
jgi:hypothetical protein